MEAKIIQGLHLTTWITSDNTLPTMSSTSMRLSTRFEKTKRVNVLRYDHFGTIKPAIARRTAKLKVPCTSQNFPASILESETLTTEEDLLLQKSEEIKPCLNGRSIYLVGMMGSGKTTIGKILSKVLGYSFFDSDKLIEEAAGGIAVAEIFKHHDENYFRDTETEVLHKLSLKRTLVISTGGGAVIRPINWEYMQKGVTIFIDVPLDALAKRLTATGTASRPLLHHGSGDAYTQTFKRLCKLWEERSEAYSNAQVTVSLERIASKLGCEDVCSVNPTQIAIQACDDFASPALT
nr:shikimate kinase, chloroplastic-like [Tanacetum cinerariifolium]